jgi:hypothetical protein
MDKLQPVLPGPKYKPQTVKSTEKEPAHNEITQTKKKDVQSHFCTRHCQREKGMVQDTQKVCQT